MIAKITIGKSFAHCIGYCLEDKQQLTDEKKKELTAGDGLRHKNRAEVLAYNQCFGNKKELTEQFRDVRKLSKRVEKPVLHASIRLAPGETLARYQWLSVAEEMAKELGVAGNQYLIVQHHDTKEQHIHLVANRVGFNGKAASTSNNFYKMDKLCRRLEKQYGLTAVLSPKQFLPKDQRLLPRHDARKEKMKEDLKHCLRQATSLADFTGKMEQLGYTVIKGRGITFIDDKKVRVKGSELGYSLATIEKILLAKQVLQIGPDGQKTDKPFLPHTPFIPGILDSGLIDMSTAGTQIASVAADLVAELFKTYYPAPDELSAAEAMKQYYRYNKKKKKKRGFGI